MPIVQLVRSAILASGLVLGLVAGSLSGVLQAAHAAQITQPAGGSLPTQEVTGVLTGNGSTLFAHVGQYTQSNAAWFYDSDHASDWYSAVINWGDGHWTWDTEISPLGSIQEVLSSHKYWQTGTYTTTINVCDSDGSTITLHGTAVIIP